MEIICFLTGMTIGLIIFSLVYHRTLRKRNTELPPEIQEKITDIWKNHPSMLLNLEMNFRQWKRMMTRKIYENKEKEERIKSNAEYEKEKFQGCSSPEVMAVSLEGYLLWVFLTGNYKYERSRLMDALLQEVCNKIVLKLNPEELDIIWQLDRKLCLRAFDHLLEHDVGVIEGMEEFSRILQNGKEGTEGR